MSEETIIEIYLVAIIGYMFIKFCKCVYEVHVLSKEFEKDDDDVPFLNKYE